MTLSVADTLLRGFELIQLSAQFARFRYLHLDFSRAGGDLNNKGYCLSTQSCPWLYSESLYKQGQDHDSTEYSSCTRTKVCATVNILSWARLLGHKVIKWLFPILYYVLYLSQIIEMSTGTSRSLDPFYLESKYIKNGSRLLGQTVHVAIS